MKILHINLAKDWGGGENQTFLLLKGLKKTKEIDLILATAKGSILEKKAKEEGIYTVNLSIFSFFVLIFKEKIDIVHCHRGGKGLLYTFLFKIAGIKTIYTKRTSFPIKRNILNYLIYKSLDKVVGISNAVGVYLKDFGLEKKMKIIYSCIDREKFNIEDGSIPEDLVKFKDLPIITEVANLQKVKGQSILIKAAEEIIKFFPNAQFLFVGEGKERKNLENLVRELKLENNVHFLGFREDIDRILYITTVFVIPSLCPGIPGSLREAVVMGKPVVASNVPGMEEIVKDGVNGFLFDKDNIMDLRDKILVLLKDKNIREKFSQENLKLSEEFSCEKMVKDYIVLYREIVNS